METLEKISISKEKILENLSERLNNLKLIPKDNKGSETIEFLVPNGPTINGTFDNWIFSHPEKVVKILEELLTLIKKPRMLFKGEFKLKVSGNFEQSFMELSYDSKLVLALVSSSTDVYKKTLDFLKGKEIEEYILKLI